MSIATTLTSSEEWAYVEEFVRFTAITTSKERLFALDVNGDVWEYDFVGGSGWYGLTEHQYRRRTIPSERK